MSEQEWPKVPKTYLTREQAASVLGIKEEEVRRLGRQGRLEASTEGSENRYETSSALRFRAEELIRAMLDRAREGVRNSVNRSRNWRAPSTRGARWLASHGWERKL